MKFKTHEDERKRSNTDPRFRGERKLLLVLVSKGEKKRKRERKGKKTLRFSIHIRSVSFVVSLYALRFIAIYCIIDEIL